jgi:hypothetical protein
LGLVRFRESIFCYLGWNRRHRSCDKHITLCYTS